MNIYIVKIDCIAQVLGVLIIEVFHLKVKIKITHVVFLNILVRIIATHA